MVDTNGITPRTGTPAGPASEGLRLPTGPVPLPPGAPQRFGLSLSPTDKNMATGSAARGGSLSLPGGAVGPGGEWTIAVQLTANLRTADGKPFAGAEHKRHMLEELARETLGKPVTIIAQETIEVPADRPGAPPQKLVQRYRVADGLFKKDGTPTPTNGLAADLRDLVTAAGAHRSARLGLIIQSHGAGAGGLAGDQGRADLASVVKAVQDGLAASGRGDKVDLLDFDSCLMGQREVLTEVSAIARHVVASSEVEQAAGPTDGQPLARSLGRLLDDPTLTAGELADALVEAADRGRVVRSGGGAIEARIQAGYGAAPKLDRAAPGAYRDPDFDSGTPTLAHFDLSAQPAFEAALNGFGEKLAEACKDPGVKARIEAIIEKTPRFAAYADDRIQQRDAKRFAERIVEEINGRALPDPTGELATAAKALLAAQADLVEKYHGEPNFAGYFQQGGLGLFLPGKSHLDVAARVAKMAPFKQADMAIEKARTTLAAAKDPHAPADAERRAEIQRLENWYGVFLGTAASRALTYAEKTPFAEALEAFAGAGTVGEQRAAADELRRSLDLLAASGFERLLHEGFEEVFKGGIDDEYAALPGRPTDGWRKFLASLR